MRKLRIAFLSAGTLTHVGPYVEFCLRQGHEVFLIAYDRPIRDYGVPVYDISRGANSWNAFSKWKYLWAGLSIRRVLRELRPDILHGHYVTSAGVISLMSGFRPYVLTAHGSDLMGTHQSRFWRPILKTMFAKAALVNPVSEQLREVAASLGVPNQKMMVSTLGVDTNVFQYRPVAEIHTPAKLICTRTLNPVYDPFTILRGCELALQNGQDFTMTFAAGGQLESQLKDYVNGHNLQDRIRFMGGFENQTLPQLLREYDACISATQWDGTSISLLEAMAVGVLPIVSRIVSNQAWVEDDKTALMFEYGDAEELARQIQRAITQPAWVKQAVETNRRIVEERGDRRKNFLRLERAYYDMLDGKNVGSD